MVANVTSSFGVNVLHKALGKIETCVIFSDTYENILLCYLWTERFISGVRLYLDLTMNAVKECFFQKRYGARRPEIFSRRSTAFIRTVQSSAMSASLWVITMAQLPSRLCVRVSQRFDLPFSSEKKQLKLQG